MSTYDGYDDDPRRYRNVRTRPRERDEPDYMREETYIERGKGAGPRGAELVYRGRDDSVEDIARDFPPPGRGNRGSTQRDYDDYASTRRTRSTGGRSRYDDDHSYYDDDRTEYTATTAAGRGRDRGARRRQDRGYDSEYSQSPPPRERRKSGVGEMLESLGLGGVAGALAGRSDRDRDRDRDRGRDRDRSRDARSTRSRSRARSRRYSSSDDTHSRSRAGEKGKTERKWAQAAQAALVAGAVEAFRSRKEPGPWTGEKGKRIATAALGAGGIDGLIDRDPDKKTKRHLVEAVIGGLAANRLANGPRSKSRGRQDRDISPDSRAPRSRSRSIFDRFRGRSQSRGRALSDDGRSVSRGPPGGGGGGGGGNGALKSLAAGGALAAAGTAIYNRVRSKSRKRRSPSNSSADSYVPSRNRRRDRRRSPPSDAETTRQTGGATDRGINSDNKSNSGALTRRAGAGAGAGAAANSHEGGKKKGEESDSSSTTDMENKRKRMRGKEMITMGLATVATIHAAHGVYSSVEAHEKRHRLVAEGEMSPEEARKKQTKAWIQDAAAVGIAALGIKGAYSEWKEMNEQRREIHEIEKRKRERRKKIERQRKSEEKERHERMMKIFEQNPQLAMGYQMNQAGTPQLQMPMPAPGPAVASDQSGNPYAPGR